MYLVDKLQECKVLKEKKRNLLNSEKDALIKQSQTQQKITDLDKLMAEEKSSGLADAMKAVKDAEKLSRRK